MASEQPSKSLIKVRLDEIKVYERVREDLGDLDALAASIRTVGLLHPVLITPERRLPG